MVASRSLAAETTAREALGVLRSAVDWLEDAPEMEAAHQQLHVAGRWVRETFGCELPWSEEHNAYTEVCPVALAHTRVGFSPEFAEVESTCTICGESPFLCSHITGRTYHAPRIPIGKLCNVCLKDDCALHETGVVYEVDCVHVVTHVVVEGVSIVDRPANPDARIHMMTLSMKELSASLGVELAPRTPISCDKCLSPCTGLRDPYSQE